MGALGDYNVVWTNESGNPGFPSIKFETDFEGFGDGASDVFAVVVSRFDGSETVQVAGKAGQVRALVEFNFADCDTGDSDDETAIDAIIAEMSCLRTTVADLTIDVMGYQEQEDGTTKIMYLVTNTGQEIMKSITFSVGSGLPITPENGSTYLGAWGEYQVGWAGSNIEFTLLDENSQQQIGGFDNFSITASNFDSASDIHVSSQIGENFHTTQLKLSEHIECQGPPQSANDAISIEGENAIEYLATKYDIQIEELEIALDYSTFYPSLEREFQIIKMYDNRPDGQLYTLLVDKNTGEMIEDISAMLKAENDAYVAQYGKVEQALYLRMQEADDSEVLPIAIWVNKPLHQGEQALFQKLVEIFPEVQETLATTGKPWSTDDPTLNDAIDREYSRLLDEEVIQRVQPLADFIESQYGVEVSMSGSLPSILAGLTKPQIYEVLQHPDVGMAHLLEASGGTALDIAVTNDIIPPVWNLGVTGGGVKVAVLEASNIDPEVDCLNLSERRNSNSDLELSDPHTTQVATVIGCADETYRGIAPGATLIDARFNADGVNGTTEENLRVQKDAYDALDWATRRTSVVNVSYGFKRAPRGLQWIDRAFDYLARARYAFVSVTAGNNSPRVVDSPGRGWNVMSVGGIVDGSPSDLEWTTDQMGSFSQFENPAGAYGSSLLSGDREKPEVVAVGALKTIGLDNIPTGTIYGTSFAAPQVTGLAALLIHRNLVLQAWPEAIRAIMMASATNNITGPEGIPSGIETDLQDGAGAINGIHADRIAQTGLLGSREIDCGTKSCWWGFVTNSSTPVVDGETIRYFNASQGQYIRIAISWWSQADPPADPSNPFNISTDQLSTDFDMHVQYWDSDAGRWRTISTAKSNSSDNNYEMVTFSAPKTARYQVVMTKVRQEETENWNWIGGALLKLPYRLGDVNCNGKINATDGMLILQYERGRRSASTAFSCEDYVKRTVRLDACDVNNNGQCNQEDALLILQCDVGLGNEFCPEGEYTEVFYPTGQYWFYP